MANLKTLDGISDAREALYNQLEAKDIDEKRALAMERVLRGQIDLKAIIPLRALAIVKSLKGPSAERYSEPLLRAFLRFTTGEELPPPPQLQH